jgi:FlaA1/EpsC-like NDP-sugar epimerase
MVASYVLACVIRFDTLWAWPRLVEHQSILWLSLLIRLPIYAWFGLYRRLWRYASSGELIAILQALTLSSCLIFVLNLGVLPALGLPASPSRSLIVLDWMLNVILLGGARLLERVAQERTSTRELRGAGSVFITNPRKVLIAGAGDAGAMIVRELKHNPGLGIAAIGFLDDDPLKQGMLAHGVPVVGRLSDVGQVVPKLEVDEVIAAMPTAPGEVIRQLRRACAQAGVTFRTVPGIYELLDNPVQVGKLRDVRIEDLLRREPVVTDQDGVAAYIRGACVLVTGAGGSIGSELCRQIARQYPSRLLVLGHGEFSIYNIEREMRRTCPDLPLVPIIADVRDAQRIEAVIRQWRPSVVFHAAAHKHVPLMEHNVEEAFANNVLGSQTVLAAAEGNGVERFVLISTDKAVNPSSAMGATKRIAEMLVQCSAARTGRQYVAVRFGNVLGSRGSAVPLFQEQIASGGPVTITDERMQRYFMTIPEAVQLVLQAAAMGSGGEVFLLDMGQPVRIVDLVNDLIELSGHRVGEDIAIKFTGVRPGEKLYEELYLDHEDHGTTAHRKIFVLRHSVSALPCEAELVATIGDIARRAERLDRAAVIAGLTGLVPTYQPSDAASRDGKLAQTSLPTEAVPAEARGGLRADDLTA